MLARVNVRNPEILTVTEYVPGCTVVKRYAPVASVTPSCDAPVWLSVIVTVAPAPTAPVAALPLRPTDPYKTCAASGGADPCSASSTTAVVMRALRRRDRS